MSGDQSIDFGVLRDVRIEKIERDSSDLREPCLSENFLPANIHDDGDSFARGVENRRHCELGFKHIRVTFFLPAVVRNVLPEVAEPIEKTDRNDRSIKIAR